MRSSTAFVLATLAVGQAAAGALKHASFHARRSNPAQDQNEIDIGKRAAFMEAHKRDVDWTKVDWSKVDWSTINYGAPVPSSLAPVPSSSAVKSIYVPEVTPTPTPISTPKVAETPTPKPSPKAAPSKKVEIEDVVTGALLEAADKLKLLALGFIAAATNPTSGANAIVSSDGPYHAEITNDSGDDAIFVCWEGPSSWVNSIAPLITLSIGAGSTKSVSFSNSFSGACSVVYSDTKLVNGQVAETWFELTTGQYGTYDVSREVNMLGHSMSVVGPSCTSDMNTCVFKCSSGNSCMTGYELVNCANGSQKGATYGIDPNLNAPSGGCSGMGDSAKLAITLS